MSSLIGTARFAIDHKGRVSIPVAMRRMPTGKPIKQFLLNHGFDGCLTLFTKEQWSVIEEKLHRVAIGKPEGRAFMRAYLMDATWVSVDAQGRITIPPALLSRAGLSKDAVLFGRLNCIEIWNAKKWDEVVQVPLRDMDRLAEDILGEGS
jgi:MraZ protein